jgi:hypothetical protein
MQFPPSFRTAALASLLFPVGAFATGQTLDHPLVLSNGLVKAKWTLSDGHIKPTDLTDLASRKTIELSPTDFSILLKNGQVLTSSSMKVVGTPKFEALKRDGKAPKLTDRLPGRELVVKLSNVDGSILATLKAVLRNGSRYLREEISIGAVGQDISVKKIQLIDLPGNGLSVDGSATGSPLVGIDRFASTEDPLSVASVSGGRAISSLERKLPIKAGQHLDVSSVIGFTDPGQLRRTFLKYVERERAHPYRTFLHYNSWYDIGYFTPYNEKDCVDAIHAFNTELVKKRGAKMSSFLFDDGWDDTSTVWEFHKGFPNGFLPVKAAAAEIGASPGIWLSPWGGYAGPRGRRLATGKAQGYEIDSEGYALSGTKYFKRFHDVTLDLVQKYGINQFKFDGTGSPDKQYPGSAFGSDFEAAIQLIHDLREAKPSLFINLTTGTWPSPFWTRYADSIWRGGNDHSFAGVGSNRQKWITYRDGDTYNGVVRRGPLYPLNSLMLHGIIYARHADRLNVDPQNDFKSEVRDYFSTGTQLQEMYITPSLLTSQNWDDLAEAAKWSRANQDVLVDTHWVGGNPMKLEAYGWASWTPKKGLLTLRNPSDKPQAFSVDLERIFELPKGAATNYSLHSPWKEDKGKPSMDLKAGESKVVILKPFEVLVLEAKPQ